MTARPSRKRKAIQIAAWSLATFFVLLLVVATATWVIADRAGKSFWVRVQADLKADGEVRTLAELHLHPSAQSDDSTVSNYGSIPILQDISEPHGKENRERLESLFLGDPSRLPVHLATSPALPASDLNAWADGLWKVVEYQRTLPLPLRSMEQDFPSDTEQKGDAFERIEAYLNYWQPTVAELRRGIDREVARFEPAIAEREEFPEYRSMTHLAAISRGSLALYLHALVAARSGNRDAFLVNLQTLSRLAEACANEKQLFAHYEASRLMLMLETGIVEGFRAGILQEEPDALRQCMSMLQRIDLHATLGPALRDEILATADQIGACSTLEGMSNAVPEGTPMPNLRWYPPGWFQNQQGVYLGLANAHLFKALRNGACFGDQIEAAKYFDTTLSSSLNRSHRLIILFTPLDGMHYIHYVPACAEAYRRMALIACAIELYRLNNEDQNPPTLAALVPQFLEAIPTDPMVEAPMRYLRHDDNSYQLWSIAIDRVDDKGHLNIKPNRGGPSGKYADLSFHTYTGDWPWPGDIAVEK